MNPVQELLITGSTEAGCQEKTADCCLYLPSAMWRGKNVQIVRNNENFEVSEEKGSWLS